MENPQAEHADVAEPEPLLRASVLPGDFIPLMRAVMERDRIKPCELAKRTGLSEPRVCRLLSSKRSIDNPTLFKLFEALNIDTMRALLAVTHFGSWEHYFEPDVEIIADLIDVLPAALHNARTECERAKISKPGSKILAERLANMIAANDRETARRRREFPLAGE